MAAGVAALVGAMTGSAFASPIYPTFTIQPSALGGPAVVPPGGGVTISTCPNGALNGCVDADKIIGNYTEVITSTGTAASGTFSVDVAYTAAAFIDHADSGGAVQLAGSQSGLGNNYSIYGLFSAGGTYACTATACTFTADPTLGSALALYKDVSPMDTTLTLPATSTSPGTNDVIRTGNLGNDVLLATSTLVSGKGVEFLPLPCTITSGNTCGSFTLVFNPFNLTSDGAKFFVKPTPFYLTLDLSGQFNNAAANSTSVIGGSADAVFATAVPEPASLTLLGIGLIGLARRRFKKGIAA